MACIKICGLTRIADLRLALRLGATYVGAVVEIPRSPRSLSLRQAQHLLRCAPGSGVLVTDRSSVSDLTRLVDACAPFALQLHGDPSPAEVATFLRAHPRSPQLWVAVPLPVDAAQAHACLDLLISASKEYAEAGAAAIVLDSRVGRVSGGTGVPMDWCIAAEFVRHCPLPVLVAGGINPDNAARALSTTGAAGLDVSSGVEDCPGIKSPCKLRALFRACMGEAP